MQLPALRNSVPASLNGQSIEDFIRNSTQNLQRAAAAMPGSGVAGAVYLGFDGTTGVWKLNKEAIDPKGLGRILVPQHGLFEGYIEWANGSPLQKTQRQLLGVTVRAFRRLDVTQRILLGASQGQLSRTPPKCQPGASPTSRTRRQR